MLPFWGGGKGRGRQKQNWIDCVGSYMVINTMKESRRDASGTELSAKTSLGRWQITQQQGGQSGWCRRSKWGRGRWGPRGSSRGSADSMLLHVRRAQPLEGFEQRQRIRSTLFHRLALEAVLRTDWSEQCIRRCRKGNRLGRRSHDPRESHVGRNRALAEEATEVIGFRVHFKIELRFHSQSIFIQEQHGRQSPSL